MLMVARKPKPPRSRPPGFDGKRELQPAEIESPYDKGNRESAIKNIREHSLATMYARGQIDMAQLCAGEWVRRQYERTRMGSMAIDPSYEPVDSSGHADPIPDRMVTAIDNLNAAEAYVGKAIWPIVIAVCGEGLTITEAAVRYFKADSNLKRKATGVMLGVALDHLAVWIGAASPPRNTFKRSRNG